MRLSPVQRQGWHGADWPCANTWPRTVDIKGVTPLRTLSALTVAMITPWLWVVPARAESFAQLAPVPAVASTTCAGSVSAEAEVALVQVGDHVGDGVRVVINFDADIYDGSCALTVTARWANLDSGAAGSGDITAVSTIDQHYGFVGYANTTFDTGNGTVVVTLSSHPGAELRITA